MMLNDKLNDRVKKEFSIIKLLCNQVNHVVKLLDYTIVLSCTLYEKISWTYCGKHPFYFSLPDANVT